MTLIAPSGVEVLGHLEPGYRDILSHEALGFLAGLHRRFEKRRQSLLRYRKERQAELDQGALLMFPHETVDIRSGEWKVRPAPADLQDRRVEITGPVDRKMVVNARDPVDRILSSYHHSHPEYGVNPCRQQPVITQAQSVISNQ